MAIIFRSTSCYFVDLRMEKRYDNACMLKTDIWKVPVELLNQASLEELRAFVLEQAEKSAMFLSRLNQWLYKQYDKPERTWEGYVDRVRRLFSLIEDKFGWYAEHFDERTGVAWGSVGEGMEAITVELQEMFDSGCIDIVVEPILEFFVMTQSNRDGFLYEGEYTDLHNAHDACISLLSQWSRHPSVPMENKREMLRTLLEICHFSAYKEHGIYNMLKKYIRLTVSTLSPQEAYDSLIRLEAEGIEDYEIDQQKVLLLHSLGREEQAVALVYQNLDNGRIVDIEIDRLVGIGKLDEAMRLAEAVIEELGEYGTTLERKLRIAKLMKDEAAIKDTYYRLTITELCDTTNYKELKAIVPAKEWPVLYKRVIHEVQKAERVDYLAAIYEEESDMKRLNQLLLREDVSQLRLIIRYLPILPAQYHPPLIQRGIDILKKYAEHTSTRNDYADYARKIKEFSRLPGAASAVAELLSYIRFTYARRPAMLDELSKL